MYSLVEVKCFAEFLKMFLYVCLCMSLKAHFISTGEFHESMNGRIFSFAYSFFFHLFLLTCCIERFIHHPYHHMVALEREHRYWVHFPVDSLLASVNASLDLGWLPLAMTLFDSVLFDSVALVDGHWVK